MSQICEVPACQRPVKGRGLCEAHLVRLRKTGDVQADVPVAPRQQPLDERLLSHVDYDTLPGCWLWTGSLLPDGYGQTVVGSRRDDTRRSERIHRLAYEVWVGPVPEGAHVDHTCHNRDESCHAGDVCLHRRCFNPEHLEAVTPLVNAQRSHHAEAMTAAAASRTHCSRGHEWTSENTHWSNGHRWCRACNRIRAAKKRAKRAASLGRQPTAHDAALLLED